MCTSPMNVHIIFIIISGVKGITYPRATQIQMHHQLCIINAKLILWDVSRDYYRRRAKAPLVLGDDAVIPGTFCSCNVNMLFDKKKEHVGASSSSSRTWNDQFYPYLDVWCRTILIVWTCLYYPFSEPNAINTPIMTFQVWHPASNLSYTSQIRRKHWKIVSRNWSFHTLGHFWRLAGRTLFFIEKWPRLVRYFLSRFLFRFFFPLWVYTTVDYGQGDDEDNLWRLEANWVSVTR